MLLGSIDPLRREACRTLVVPRSYTPFCLIAPHCLFKPTHLKLLLLERMILGRLLSGRRSGSPVPYFDFVKLLNVGLVFCFLVDPDRHTDCIEKSDLMLWDLSVLSEAEAFFCDFLLFPLLDLPLSLTAVFVVGNRLKIFRFFSHSANSTALPFIKDSTIIYEFQSNGNSNNVVI